MHKDKNYLILEDLAKEFRSLRRKSKMTQQDLSDKSGIAISQIARIETAKLNVGVCTLIILARAMGVKPYKLLLYIE